MTKAQSRPRCCSATLCAGCGSDTDIWLERPSPDRSTVAILFTRSGGGAAGWFEYVVALQPASIPPTPPKTLGNGPSLEVLPAGGARRFAFEWTSDSQLTVDAAYDVGDPLAPVP